MTPPSDPRSSKHARPRAQRALFAAAISGAIGAVAVGCSFDWQVRPQATEGGAPDTSLADVSVVETSIDAPDDVAADGSDADPCDALRAAVVSTLKKAKRCTFGTSGQCSTTVRDECDCDVVVSVAGSTEATAYVQAVADLHAASCAPSPACAASCPVLPPKPSWSCLGMNVCYPPAP